MKHILSKKYHKKGKRKQTKKCNCKRCTYKNCTYKQKRKHGRKYKRRHNKKTKRRRRTLKGGTNALVGTPLDGGNIKTWPGVSPGNNGNHYLLSENGVTAGGFDPYFGTANNQSGGKRGTIIPQSLVKLGRDMVAGPTKFSYAWAGEPLPVSTNPNPTSQPIDTNVVNSIPNPPDILAIHQDAGNSVANL